jgi:hypothetical protein
VEGGPLQIERMEKTGDFASKDGIANRALVVMQEMAVRLAEPAVLQTLFQVLIMEMDRHRQIVTIDGVHSHHGCTDSIGNCVFNPH